jgi:[acyl-carrier-protein] S-malonyltransferase
MQPNTAYRPAGLLQLGDMSQRTAYALVFPGQGSQSVGMAHQLSQAFPEAQAAFAAADDALGTSISQLAWDGPAELLDQTANAQPALLAASIAYLYALRAARTAAGQGDLRPRYYAGHSMGQYSALVASGALELADAVRLVRERGRLMQAAGGDGAMAALIGLDDARLPEVLAAGAALGTVGVANRNAPGQIVISGARPAVEAAAEAARGSGARRAIMLPVSVAAHSPLMRGAADAMRAAVEAVPFQDPSAPLLANADARPLTSAADCRAELIDHLTTGVDWVAAVQTMSAGGVTTFLEVGPGRVLTGLGRRIVPDVTSLAVDDAAAPGGLALPDLEGTTAASRGQTTDRSPTPTPPSPSRR